MSRFPQSLFAASDFFRSAISRKAAWRVNSPSAGFPTARSKHSRKSAGIGDSENLSPELAQPLSISAVKTDASANFAFEVTDDSFKFGLPGQCVGGILLILLGCFVCGLDAFLEARDFGARRR